LFDDLTPTIFADENRRPTLLVHQTTLKLPSFVKDAAASGADISTVFLTVAVRAKRFEIVRVVRSTLAPWFLVVYVWPECICAALLAPAAVAV
jgi:hypothetical protein